MRVSLPWTLRGLHYHGIGMSRRNSQEPILAPWEPFQSQNPTTPRLSLINSASASLTIVLHESRNRAPKFLEFRRNFNCSRRRPPRHSRLQSTDLSGTLTADGPGKIRRLGRPSIDRTRNFSFVVCASLVDWNSLDFRDLGSRFIAGLALHQWTFSRSMSGRTLGPDGAVSQSSGPWFYGPRRGRSTNEPRSRSTIELRKSDAWIAFFGRVHP